MNIRGFANTYRLPLVLGLVSIFLISLSFAFRLRENSNSTLIFTTNEASSSTRLTTTIHIDIEGQVNSPGVYEMNSESRVNDLIVKAGGLTDEADIDWVAKFINKAQILHDGDKLYIPSHNETIRDEPRVMGALSVGGSVNINSASQKELESLPGIGEKTAEKIIQERPYSSIQDLKDKKVVGQAVFEKIKDLISVL